MVDIVAEFVGLPSPATGRAGAGGHPCQGIYHRPAGCRPAGCRPAGCRPATAFIATHYNVDFFEHYIASYLAERGYGFPGWNTRFRGNEANFLLTSQCIAAPHLARITQPSLVVHATADACVYDSDARALFDARGGDDKTLEFIKGDRYLQEPPGARDRAADLIAAWVAGRAG